MVDITDLGDQYAAWMFKKADLLSQIFRDLQDVGGLQATEAQDEGELIARCDVVHDATCEAVPDIIVLENPNTGTWLNHVKRSSFRSHIHAIL